MFRVRTEFTRKATQLDLDFRFFDWLPIRARYRPRRPFQPITIGLFTNAIHFQ